MERVVFFILLYYSVGGIVFVSTTVFFHHVYDLMPFLVKEYEIPYPLKRLVLSTSIGAIFFQTYLALLEMLFKRESFFYYHISRKWLTIDETEKVRKNVTAVPWWVSIVLLYFMAIILSLL